MSKISTTTLQIDVGKKQPYALEINRQDVTLRGLPESMHGATFVHLSDLHGGFAGLEAVYEESIRQVNSLDADYLFFTGDYMDKRAQPADFPMQDYLSRFCARRGKYGSFGNHDHRRGIVGSKRLLQISGIRGLYNESIELEPGFRLAAVDDLHEGKPDIAATFAQLPPDRTSIVLSHNPRLIEKARNRDVLILSGHTHGAQFRLPFPTPLMICYLHLRCWQVAGWYQKGRTRLYVNRGLGVTGKPLRINCPAEIGVFRMLPEPSEQAVFDRTVSDSQLIAAPEKQEALGRK